MEVCIVHIFIFILKNIIAHKIDFPAHEELFGTGKFSNGNSVSFFRFFISFYIYLFVVCVNHKLQIDSHISSSTEDLIKLFHHEKSFTNSLSSVKEAIPYLKQINHTHK